MRQIKQFTHALEQVLFKKKEGKQQEAQAIIKQTLNELLEKNDGDFQELSLDEITTKLENGGNFNAELALVVAELLYEKGELIDNSESKKYYMQVLLLYQKAMKNPEVAFPLQATQKISQIKNELNSSELEKVKQLLE